MSEADKPIAPPADAVEIYHKTHGVAHCHKDQLKDMKSEGWSTTKPKADESPKA